MRTQLVLFVLLTLCYSQRYLHTCQAGSFWNGQRCMPCMSYNQNGYCTCSSYNTCDQLVCSPGYYPIEQDGIKKCVKGCDSGCQSCGIYENAEVCYSCVHQFVSSVRLGSICFPIENVENCVLYNPASGVCQDCEAGYFLNLQTVAQATSLYTTQGSASINGVICQPCEIPNCGQCDSANTCKQCFTGYQLVSSTFQQPTCVRCYDANCKNCPEKLSVCTLCAVGYYLAGSQCVKCSVDNCQACSDAKTCTFCDEKFYVANEGLRCGNCPKNCLQCSDSQTCQICEPGIQASRGKCLICPSNCLNCYYDDNYNVLCSLCQEGNYLNDKHVCQSCSLVDPNAARCAGPNDLPTAETLQVTQCKQGGGQYPYFLTTSQAGVPYCAVNDTSVCLTISAENEKGQFTCESCFPSYVLFNGTCKQCPQPLLCTQCSANAENTALQCSECAYGSYLNEAFSCQSCSNNCFECTKDGCTSCFSGYLLNQQKQCTKCPNNCIECSSTTVCTKCASGFFDNTVDEVLSCYPCRSECQTCMSPGNTCETCKPGMVKNGTGCVSVSNGHCVQTDESSNCTVCDYGYYLNMGHCLKCVSPNSGFVCRKNVIQNTESDEEDQGEESQSGE